MRVERTGAERMFQRIGQEYASRIHAVDVVNSSDAAHFIVWKRDGLLAPFLPEDVAKYYPADHRDSVVGPAELIEGEVEGYSQTSDGTRIPVAIRSSPISYKGCNAILLHVRDISESRRAQKALRESEERYRLLFDRNPQPMWVHDLQSRHFLAVNQATLRLYKYSQDEFALMPSIDAIWSQPRNESTILLCLPNLVEVGTARHRRKDGSTVLVELTQHTMTLDDRVVALVMISKIIPASR